MKQGNVHLGIILDPKIVSADEDSDQVHDYVLALKSAGLSVFNGLDSSWSYEHSDAKDASVSLLSATGSIRTLREFGRQHRLFDSPCFDMFAPQLHYYSNYQHMLPPQSKLNSEGVVLPFSEVYLMSFTQLLRRLGKPESTKSIFMRPDPALKICEAEVLDRDNWDSWKLHTSNHTGVSASTFLWWFETKDIAQEFRCFMLEGKLISASGYGFGKESFNADDNAALKVFVEDVAKHIMLDDPCYVIDVALIPGGQFKVIELNCASTSGIYSLEKSKIAQAWKDGLMAIYEERYA